MKGASLEAGRYRRLGVGRLDGTHGAAHWQVQSPSREIGSRRTTEKIVDARNPTKHLYPLHTKLKLFKSRKNVSYY